VVRTSSKNARLALAFTSALAAYPGCTEAKTGGETHWLGDCDDDTDCGGGQCLCDVCSRVCSGDGDCGGSRRAQCYAVGSPGLARRCESPMPRGTGICLAVCSNDAECPSGEECLLGACVAPVAHDAGPAPEEAAPAPEAAIARPPTGDIATQYVNRDAGTRFGETVLAPEPSPFIAGAPEDLVGLWEQVGGDGELCTPTDHGLCMQLRIEKQGATGAIVGHASFSWPDSSTATPAGPFPKATDPDHGYPVGVAPRAYGAGPGAAPEYAGVEYTAFDGHAEGDTLSFWVSGAELWRDWCALQTPYPFRVEEMSGYRCVPQDATAVNMDYGKFLLCTSAYDEGVCSVENSPLPPSPVPCLCIGDAGRSDLRCGTRFESVCNCTASRCEANLRTDLARYRFTIAGDTMRNAVDALELRKVSP
jgi:hypothetical protein